jgi:hypothetical protein
MALLPFRELISESGDLQLLHTAANINVPKIHKTEDGAFHAVHTTTTGEHADWLKGKFEKALKSNPARSHITMHVKHENDTHQLHITHKPPEKKSLKEAAKPPRFDHREAATHNIVHPDMAKHMKVGTHVDFYHPKHGDKEYGKTVHNDGKSVKIHHEGKVHTFKVATTYPGHGVTED